MCWLQSRSVEKTYRKKVTLKIALLAFSPETPSIMRKWCESGTWSAVAFLTSMFKLEVVIRYI